MKNSLNIEKLSQRTEELGLSQSKLAKDLGVSRESVSKWFQNEVYPRPDKLLKLARVLDLNFSDLVTRVTTVNEPVVAFRKKGSHKITDDYIEQARDMGRILSDLVSYLPFDDLSQPAILRNPVNNYDYVQKAAQRIRSQIGVQENDEIGFDKLINFFINLHAVIIPVLWGSKENHENALHIYLPESMTTWIYLNLDCRLHDFKFWMAHELGHVHTPQLTGEAGEDFAEAFAGALLVPQELAEHAYNKLTSFTNPWVQINHIKEVAERLVVSPLSVYYEINKYAAHHGKPKIDLETKREIFQATTNFNKEFKPVSECLFGTKTPPPSRYIACAREDFGSPFFDILKSHITKQHKSESFVQSLLNIPLLDARNVYEELL
ncbi:MAG: helix-turn-helix domain-containing protein [Desulfuromonadales bacterium]|nr:helix-turn-helix domain-containing protein [Desulfuromonadales bacterium]